MEERNQKDYFLGIKFFSSFFEIVREAAHDLFVSRFLNLVYYSFEFVLKKLCRLILQKFFEKSPIVRHYFRKS
jgi:hypothetical protein